MDRFLFAKNVRPEQTWELLMWSLANGVTECTVDMLWLDGGSAPYVARFLLAMEPFALPKATRPHLSAPTRTALNRATDLWTVNAASIGVLREFFPDGLFMYPTSDWEEGCLEDPTFYRDGKILFGIVSHENEGMLSLTPAEHKAVAELGIATGAYPEWI